VDTEDTTAAAGDSPPGAAAQEKDVPALAAELERARQEADEFRDSFLRAKAEAENVRRRTEAELANAARYGVEPLARELLSVRDSLDLARSVDFRRDDQDAVEKMVEGLELTLKLLDSAFVKTGLSVVDPQPGEKFDPALHQAMGTQESEEVAPNHVVQVIQRGYRLHDRLLRPAMVMVSKGAGKPGG
jgi:molecular chaperone GrpE